MVFVVRFVEYRIITERDIADDDIKIIVGDLCFLIALHLDIGIRIEHLRDLARNLIYLNAVQRYVAAQIIGQ